MTQLGESMAVSVARAQRFGRMRPLLRKRSLFFALAIAATVAAALGVSLAPAPAAAAATPMLDDDAPVAGRERHRNESGVALTISSTGKIDRTSPFFTSIGTNGRTCESCHQAAEGWSVTPKGIRERFEASRGT
ncbi:MAG: hypothetical protein ABIO71_08435, partial [Caldimonas sp.]